MSALHFRRNTWVGALIAVLALGGAAAVAWQQRGADYGADGMAPAFELKDEAGRTHVLDDYRGRPFVLHFWATWCPPCIEEFPKFLAAAKKSAGSTLAWVAVSLDHRWQDANRFYPKDLKAANLVALLDPKMSLSEKFGSYQFPESYVIDASGRVAAKWVGPQKWDSPELEAELARIVKGEPPVKARASQ